MNNDKRKELSPYDRWPRKRGQPLIELLVVMLVVTVLSVAILTALKPYIVQAEYMAEAIPALGNFRTHIELYRVESERLPGLGVSSAGVPGGTTQLAPGLSKVQTVAITNAAFAADFSRKVEVTGTNHVLRQADVSLGNLAGKRMRPQHFQYRVDACESNRSLYAVGAFGVSTKGSGLPAGTGYAVLEWQSPGVGEREKGVAVWKRWRAAARSPRQVVMVSASEARAFFGCETAEQALDKDLCWIGDPEALLSSDPMVCEMAKAALHEAGWELDGFPPIPWYREWVIPLLLVVVFWNLGRLADGFRLLTRRIRCKEER